MENVAQDKPTPFTRNTIVQLYIIEREKEMNTPMITSKLQETWMARLHLCGGPKSNE